jgi:hypothetical protein
MKKVNITRDQMKKITMPVLIFMGQRTGTRRTEAGANGRPRFPTRGW